MDVRETLAGVWKTSERKVIASLVRIVRDIGTAEDVAHEALLAALTDWPGSGVPANPEAWLMTTAKRRAFNVLRHERVKSAHAPDVEEPSRSMEEELEMGIDGDIGDDVLRLVFLACHPVLPWEQRVALTLRLICGLTTGEIARAFLTTETTVQQRIVRAKRALAEAGVPFELPRGAELGGRLGSVLEVVYLVFNEGHLATSGGDVMRPALQEEALRLGRLLAELAPMESEVHGLCALMDLTASRAATRTDAAGEPVLLRDQDRSKWDAASIARGRAALERAARTRGTAVGPGSYELQAAIAAEHARATDEATTDWRAIVERYEALEALTKSPIVRLNRAIAVGFADGPRAALAELDALASENEAALARYHLLPAARAEMLERLGQVAEARAEFTRAAGLVDNDRQRDRLLARAAKLGASRVSG